ncbi:glutathione S-transferase family protein [Paraburkholderia susongensis]|uniref:Glutathione S-transferase n=1 Tax=Paraburkholderia susongensis TaxID=1515439 RepID=A0A1X7M1I2_9BURK|nr:glutathione S-transferase family protein [Paraburkholderia susongensis]SMG59577.1 glutathione S-transferase [Paraburkholderia susongensis]
MVKLARSDIRTTEVLSWKGLHLFHAPMSTCSQKVRTFLNLKGVDWTSHTINIGTNETLSEYFLGINPRGLVPVLVDEGDVHIESNDILLHIEKRFPSPSLVPAQLGSDIEKMLEFENDLHLDMRALTFRFLVVRSTPPKSADDLKNYRERGAGTVGGVKDLEKEREFEFWDRYNREGITDEVSVAAALRFHAAFSDLNQRLTSSRNIASDDFSLVDIAWIIYTQRLSLLGYPVQQLHPKLFDWFSQHQRRVEIGKEIAVPQDRLDGIARSQAQQKLQHQSFMDICGPALGVTIA